MSDAGGFVDEALQRESSGSRAEEAEKASRQPESAAAIPE